MAKLITSKLTPQDRAIIAGEVAGSLNLGSFAKAADLKVVMDNYVSATDFEARLKREVEGLSLVTHTQLQNSLPTPNVLPPNLEDRLRKLEIEITEPGGIIMAMEARLKDLQDRKVRSAIHVAGYTFKDQKTTDVWALTLGGDDVIRYFRDARAQLSDLSTRQKTSVSIVQEEANAKKAGFPSAAAARIQTSFDITFPETIFKDSPADKHAAQGGIIFTPPFATSEILLGNTEISSKDTMMKKLASNRTQFQTAIA